MNKKQLAVMMFVEDIPVNEIAEELEVSVPTIYAWLEAKDIGASVRKQKYDEAVRLYAETDTPVTVICSTLKLSPPTLYTHVHERKVPLRSSGKHIKPETIEDIIELYKDGAPINTIIALYPMHPPKLYAILHKHKVKPCRKRVR